MKNLSQISVILMKNLSHFGHLRLAGMQLVKRFCKFVDLKMLIQYDLPTKKIPNNIHECSA